MLISTFVFFYLLWNQAPVREPAQDANHLAGSGEQSCPAGGGQNPLPPAQQSPGEDQGDQCAHDESPAGNYSNFISFNTQIITKSSCTIKCKIEMKFYFI